MRALISALAVAGLVAIALPSYAQNNDVKTNPKPLNAPGRAIDEGNAVKTDPAKAAKTPGRAADDSGKQDVTTGKPAKYGRAADDTSKPATTSKSKKKKKAQTPTN